MYNPWNKGLTKETDQRIAQYCSKRIPSKITCKGCGKISANSKRTKTGYCMVCYRKSPEFKNIHKNFGNNGSTHGGQHSRKTYKYITLNGTTVFMHSTYEIKLANILDDMHVEWTRGMFFKWLDENNKQHNYFPDFYIPSKDLYLDPKNNYLLIKDLNKITRVREQNKINLITLSKNDLCPEKIAHLI